ncbi:MAG: aspartate kinase [Firmicutes bacterium]|nr:aspartate kinase [Bacillota bacterium]
MRLIIQKFGGSSLANPSLRQKVIQHVKQAVNKGYFLVVVVSALGRKGDPYATDTLQDFLAQTVPAPPLRETDLLLSCGESIAAAVVAAELQQAGCNAVALTGWQAGIITDGYFGRAEIKRINKENLLRLLQNGKIAVVAGFQGISEEGEVTTLGRGGSDITAVALGAALEAEFVEIYSDVAAVMTADPNLVPEAKPILHLGYQEVLQMAQGGAKVIHPRAVDIALQYNLPLVLKKTGEDEEGTVVSHQVQRENFSFLDRTKIVTGITHVTGLAQVQILTDLSEVQTEEVLKVLSNAGISIDLISLSPQEKMFTIDAREGKKAAQLMQNLGIEAKIETGFAKVTIVGSGMRGIPGVMVRIVSALNKAKTQIRQTADSHVNISCLVREENVAAAVRALHTEFGLDGGK